ncbi:MAG TPA: sulfotransferase, partial [Devosiaceae bacterium]|nr:sulfotransferase [Devosiaceae bacterium]
MNGPDFVGIGAGRSGTTWTHRVLADHPAIWMTPIKELHHFDDPGRKRYFRDLGKRLRHPGRLTKWDARYFLGRNSDRWYGELFAAARRRGLRAGEITPEYALLDDAGFARLRAVNDAVRIV